MNNLVQQRIDDIIELCKTNSVAELYLFGSAVKPETEIPGDLDFAILFSHQMSPIDRDESFLNVLEGLEKLFNINIDLVSYSAIKNPIFKSELDSSKVTLYAA